MSRYSGDRRPSQLAAKTSIAAIAPFRRFAPAGLILGFILVLLISCGDESPTVAPTATIASSPTPVTITTPAPTDTPSPTATAVPSPSPTQAPTLAPTAAATPDAPLPSPTAEPASAQTPTPPPLELEVSFPSGNTVINSDTFTVTGITSPDATVSVNGDLATLDVEGRFAVDLTILPWENPLAVEVIATSLSGESSSVVRTVIFIP